MQSSTNSETIYRPTNTRKPSLSSLAAKRLRDDSELRERAERAFARGERFAPYRFAPERYIREQLGWTPWCGTPEAPGQADILEAYALALRQQHERQAFERDGDETQLTCWQPGQVIKNTIRVEAGHTVGKTTLSAGIVSHFFDCFAPSITYCFAPGHDQINDLLFKEIRKQRAGRNLPGRVLETPEIKDAGDHFVKGRATNNAHGQGTERVQGQHEQYLMFVIDEAEGVADFVFDAIKSMASGGIAIVLMLANPRTRTSRFHRTKEGRTVENFRISCLSHPNVLAGRDVIPGAVRRDYVEAMIDDGDTQHCEVVAAHDPDVQTFEVPWRPGVIYKPDREFMFRVLGVAPQDGADNTFVSVGRYEAAKQRAPVAHDPHIARMGVDVARYGNDYGTLWLKHNGSLKRLNQFYKLDSGIYFDAVREAALQLVRQGVVSLHIRVDGGGGFGSGLIDQLNRCEALRKAFRDFRVLEVHFNGTPHKETAYADLGTEMYAELAESLKGLALVRPPAELEADLCERPFTWVNTRGVDVKKLTPKEAFKKAFKRSPDDGDGVALAAAPDSLFAGRTVAPVVGGQRPALQGYRPR